MFKIEMTNYVLRIMFRTNVFVSTSTVDWGSRETRFKNWKRI